MLPLPEGLGVDEEAAGVDLPGGGGQRTLAAVLGAQRDRLKARVAALEDERAQVPLLAQQARRLLLFALLALHDDPNECFGHNVLMSMC
jgi:hypothetical protein